MCVCVYVCVYVYVVVCMCECVCVCTCMAAPLPSPPSATSATPYEQGCNTAVEIFSKPALRMDTLISGLTAELAEFQGSRAVLLRHPFNVASSGTLSLKSLLLIRYIERRKK